jgi:eukaryotic-like serine/threonine-protein kinase
MNPERLRQIENLYRAALEQQPGQRSAFLARTCGEDEDLRRQVESLFAHTGESTASLADDTEYNQADGGPVLPPGTRLGPYEIVGPLGRGGMGRVYRGLDTRLDRPVAIKVSGERFGGQFEREARAISALNHAHVCTLYDVGPNYLVMELVEGETLAARLRKGQLAADQVLRYGGQIADALAAAHKRGIVHRDLKPANIMITEAGIKVLDFGVAISPERPGTTGEETISGRDAIMGTRAYMAPEQLAGRECDARTDIFALGLVLYEMATGTRASRAPDRAAHLAEMLSGQPSPLDVVPAQLARVVQRCVEKDPDRRWQAASDVKLALEPSQLKAVTGSRARLLAAAGIAGLALAAAIGTLAILRKNPDQTLQLIPFTTFPGGQYEPAFSSDGTHVAFVWDNEKAEVFNVYAKAVAGGDPQRLTASPVSEGSPCWSPDGTRIAFLRYAAVPEEAGVYVVSTSGGSPKRLAKTFPLAHIFDRHLDWSPDGKYLAVADKESADKPFSVFLIAVETGERRKITDPLNAATGDTGPAFAPDSKTLSFRRTVSARIAGIFTVPITGGEPRRLTRDNQDFGGYAWTADGREIVVSKNSANDTGLWRVPVRGGEPRSIPSLRIWADFLAISRAGQRLALSHWFVDTNIWEFRPGPGGAAEARKLIASTREDRSPQYSPDGAKIAFRSDRSGSNEIWVSDGNGGHMVQVTKFGGPLTGSPHWSPDGAWIAFDSRPMGNGDIFVVPSGGGAVRRITFHPADDVTPSWSNDGRWIYFASNRTGTYQVWKIAADGDETKSQPVQVTRQGGFLSLESASDRSLFYAKGPRVPGIWRLTPDGREAPVLQDYPAGYWGYWCVQDGGLYFVTPSVTEGAVLQFLDLRTQQVRRVMEFERRPLFADSGLSVARGGGAILYAQADTSGSEIMLVEGFR